jgi:hypothetical protein
MTGFAARQSAQLSAALVRQFAPTGFIQLDLEFVRRFLYAPPRLVAFLVRNIFDLIEARNGIADVGSIVEGLFALLWKRELIARNFVAIAFAHFAHRNLQS